MLMTAAPVLTAASIASPDASQVIRPSLPGTVSSGTLTARAPGQTPRMPIPLRGAAATDAVAVPWELVTALPGVVVNHGSPVHSAWLGSAAASTSAISGLWAVTGGGASAGSATLARQLLGGPESGSSGTACSRRRRMLACAYTS